MSVPRVESAFDKHTWIIISEGLSVSAKHALSKGEAVEFSVKHEPWVKYVLKDGTRLFGRVIVTKIIRTIEYEPTGEPIYAWFNQAIFTALPPKELKGVPPNPPPGAKDAKDFDLTPVEFERVGEEVWNIYELSDGSTMRVKPEVTGVYRTDTYGEDGDPVYVVGVEPVQRVEAPTDLLNRAGSPAESYNEKAAKRS